MYIYYAFARLKIFSSFHNMKTLNYQKIPLFFTHSVLEIIQICDLINTHSCKAIWCFLHRDANLETEAIPLPGHDNAAKSSVLKSKNLCNLCWFFIGIFYLCNIFKLVNERHLFMETCFLFLFLSLFFSDKFLDIHSIIN